MIAHVTGRRLTLPLDRPMIITPRHLAEAAQLEKVFERNR